MSFDTEVCRRLPLADATLRMLDYVADAEFLGALFEQHRGRTYEKVISFADLIYLLTSGLFRKERSGHRAFQQAKADGELETSVRAVYDKIACVPIPLSAALLTDGTARLRPLLPATGGEPVPESLASFTPLAFDGKKIKYVAHRLKPARRVRGHVIGGKMLVAEDVGTGLAVAMEADPDGDASDLTLVPGLLARTRAVVAGVRLWIGDRLFCDLVHLPQLGAGGDHFVVRYQTKVGFHADPEKPARAGTNDSGQAFTEEWGWLGGPDDARRLYVRRITVRRPDAEDVSVVTDLIDGGAYPAPDVLTMYLRRWGIERLFQKVTEVFGLRHLVSARENGTVFQGALCVLLYNVTVVVRAHVAAGAGRTRAEVSLENLFGDLCRQLTGAIEVLGVPALVAHYGAGQWTAERLRQHLEGVLGKAWRDGWKKSPARATKPPTKTEYLVGGHCSIFKIARGMHRTVPEPGTESSPRPSKQ